MSFVDTVRKLVTTVSEALAGPVVPAVVSIARDLVDFLDNAQDVVNEDDAAELQVMRDELEPKVMAHADSTTATLRGSE
jgi:hypothetical protein